MPVAVRSKNPSLDDLRNLKYGNIIQRSASAESLRVFEEKKVKEQKQAIARTRPKKGLDLFYFRFQLLTGTYMLETWESAVFSKTP